MPTEQLEKTPAAGFDPSPRTVVIKHGVFWYHDTETSVIGGELKDIVIQKLAFNGDEVEIPFPIDQERGDKYDAFYTDEELKKIKHPSVQGELGSGTIDRPDVNTLDDGELVDWLMSTGEFDGQKKPNADEVVAAAGDDPELATRLLEAEEKAQGDSGVRKAVEDRLEKIIESE